MSWPRLLRLKMSAWLSPRRRRRLVALRDTSADDEMVRRVFAIERAMLCGPPDQPAQVPKPAAEIAVGFSAWKWLAVSPVGPRSDFISAVLRLLEANSAWHADPEASTPAAGVLAAYDVIARDLEKEVSDKRSARDRLHAEDLEGVRTLLALAHLGRADALATLEAPAEAVLAAAAAARRADPSLPYAHLQHARHLLKAGRFEEAQHALANQRAADPTDAPHDTEMARRARIADHRAAALTAKGEYWSAEIELRRVLSELHATRRPLPDWEGRLRHTLADCLIAMSREADAGKELALSAEGYGTAGCHASASWVCERRGDILAGLRQDGEAVECYQASLRHAEAIARPPDGEDISPPLTEEDATKPPREFETPAQSRDRQARLWARLGLLRLHLGDATGGRDAIDRSHGLIPTWQWINPYERIANYEVAPLLEHRTDLVATLKAHFAGRLAAAPDAERRRDLIFALRRLFERSAALASENHAQVWRRADLPADAAAAINVLTPLAVELPDFAVAHEAHVNETVVRIFGEMRERLSSRFGVRIPGVRVRINETLASDYLLLLHEQPLATGALRGAGAVRADAASLSAAGIPTTLGRVEGIAEEAWWATDHSIKRAMDGGFEIWSALRCAAAHMEALLPAHLVSFVGHQEVQNLQEDGKREDGDRLVSVQRVAELVAHETYTHMAPLTHTVRALAEERVPLDAFGEIYRLFMARREVGEQPRAVVPLVRLNPSRRDRLWGNEAGRRALLLPADWLRFLDATAAAQGSLVVERAALETFHQQLKAALGEKAAQTTLVVADRGRRALVRAAIADALPDVPVLALAELRPELAAILVAAA